LPEIPLHDTPIYAQMVSEATARENYANFFDTRYPDPTQPPLNAD